LIRQLWLFRRLDRKYGSAAMRELNLTNKKTTMTACIFLDTTWC
jgi:hypothetical protein